MGPKGVVCGPEGAWFADNCVLTKLRKCHLFLPSPIHACPCHGPWATSLKAKTYRGAKRVPDALVGAGQIRESIPTENIGPPGSLGLLGVGLTTPPQIINTVTKSKEVKTGPICQGRHCKGLKDLRVGSWNVLSLYQSGALKTLLSQLGSYKMDITAIQEIRWTGEGIIDKKNHTIFYRCDKKHHTFGTGFTVNMRIKHLVTDFKAKAPRICKICVRGLFFNYSLICVLAPTEEKDDDEKDNFYEDLEQIYEECPKRDVKIIIGDLNAKIGQEEMYRPIIGKYSLHIYLMTMESDL
jgi:hypothetical protein